MSVPLDRRAAITAINIKMLGVCFYGAVAWLCWPTSKEWWMFGILSILSGLAAAGCLVQVLRSLFELRRAETLLAKFKLKGGEQKASQLASKDALRRSGVLRD